MSFVLFPLSMPISVHGQDESDAELTTIRRSKGKEGRKRQKRGSAYWRSLVLTRAQWEKKKKKKHVHTHTQHTHKYPTLFFFLYLVHTALLLGEGKAMHVCFLGNVLADVSLFFSICRVRSIHRARRLS